jgi:hypothetical protein
VLLVAGLLLAILLSYAAIFLVFASDSCFDRCDSDLLGFGVIVGFISPYVALVLALAVSIVLLVKLRLAFWVPIVGIVLEVAGLAIGAAIVFSSVGQ